MERGDKKTIKLEFEGSNGAPVAGKIVYIHPLHRFYTVEIPGKPPLNMPIRESFHFAHRRGDNEK